MSNRTGVPSNERGASLVLVLVITVLFAGLSSALVLSTLSTHRITEQRSDYEYAFRLAESGVAYFFALYSADEAYFDLNPAPIGPISFDGGELFLEVATPGVEPGSWNLALRSEVGQVQFRLGAAIGYARLAFPAGIILEGTGDPADEVFRLLGNSTVLSYHSTDGPPDLTSPGEESTLLADGSLDVVGSSTIFGDVKASGTLNADDASVTGSVEENFDFPYEPDDFSAYGQQVIAESATANDNALLSGILGSGYSDVPGPDPSGDIDINSGSYVLPAGTYRIRKLRIGSGASLTFDTSGGPSRLIFMGTGTDGHPQNALSVSGGSLLIDPGNTTNGLLTVLAPDADMQVTSGALVGQAIGNPASGGYMQIISAGGDGTQDEISVSANSNVYGRLFAPGHLLDLGGNCGWYGSVLTRALELAGNSGPSIFGVDLDSLGGKITLPGQYQIYGIWHGGYEID